MTAYRKREPRPFDLENDALDDLLLRIKALRRHVALPAIVVAMLAACLGAAAHLFGFWPVFGSNADGSYYISFGSAVVAGTVCALPIIVPGVGVYFTLRVRLRRAWLERHMERGVSGEWLAENVQRFG